MVYLDQFLVPGILFLLTIGFGVWIARLGKPYHQILFNIHKLIALGGVVFAVLRIIELDPINNFNSLTLGLMAAAILGVVALFITGAMMSISEDEPKGTRWIHRGGLILLLISGSWAIYLIW